MTIEGVIEEALKLSEKERTEVVARLLHSLDDAGAPDPGREAAWTNAIDRRVREVRDGGVELVDAADAISQARAAVAARRR
jgi:Putative addiction module component